MNHWMWPVSAIGGREDHRSGYLGGQVHQLDRRHYGYSRSGRPLHSLRSWCPLRSLQPCRSLRFSGKECVKICPVSCGVSPTPVSLTEISGLTTVTSPT